MSAGRSLDQYSCNYNGDATLKRVNDEGETTGVCICPSIIRKEEKQGMEDNIIIEENILYYIILYILINIKKENMYLILFSKRHKLTE